MYEEAPSSSSIPRLAQEAYIAQVSLGSSNSEDSFRRASIAKAHVPDLRMRMVSLRSLAIPDRSLQAVEDASQRRRYLVSVK